MSIYSHYIFPRFILDPVMSRKSFMKKRAQVLSHAQGNVLEIGFGTGLNALYYPDHIKKITVVDVNPGMNALAKKRIAQSGLVVDQHVITAERLPFPDNTFDTVVSTWTLCSIPDVDAAIEEVRRVLKPGGKFIFIEHGLHTDARVQKWQHRLAPIWKITGGGCHLDRNINEIVSRHAFAFERLDRYVLPEQPKITEVMYEGIAIKK